MQPSPLEILFVRHGFCPVPFRSKNDGAVRVGELYQVFSVNVHESSLLRILIDLRALCCAIYTIRAVLFWFSLLVL